MPETVSEGIIVAGRHFHEVDAIITVLSSDYGRTAGLVRGGQSRKKQPGLQPGNQVEARWLGRTGAALGEFRIEKKRDWGNEIILRLVNLPLMASMFDLIVSSVSERQPYQGLYRATCRCLDRMAGAPERDFVAYCLWELSLIRELGFGIDFEKKLTVDENDPPAYVSPRTARVVGRDYGAKWKDKLLVLPRFCHDDGADCDAEDLKSALRLSGYFLNRYVFAAHGRRLPQSRALLGRLLVE